MNIDDFKIFWTETLREIEKKLGSSVFDLWFSPVELREVSNDNIVTLIVPHDFFRRQINDKKYVILACDMFESITGKKIKINMITKDEQEEFIKPIKELEKDFRIEHNSSLKRNENQNILDYKEVIPFGSIEKKQNTYDLASSSYDSFNLNPSYTFDNFIVGDDNSFAYNAALAVSEKPGVNYNPCLIFGGVGLGKTHLLQSIGNEIKKNKPNARIVYITSENFVNNFVNAVKENNTKEFKDYYRNIDVLLIDDIHDLIGKQQSVEELYYTYNNLYDSRKQIVITCDRPIKELKNFSDRLKNRFERGLNVELIPPKWETRKAIFKKKLETAGNGMNVPNDVLDYIAQNISTNVRDLEGAFMRIKAYWELQHKAITLDNVKEQLKYVFKEPARKNVSIDQIQKSVSNYYQTSIQELKGKKRTQTITMPRQIAMYIIRKNTKASTTEIGQEFGQRDHTTVMHAVAKIEEEIKNNPQLKNDISEIMKELDC